MCLIKYEVILKVSLIKKSVSVSQARQKLALFGTLKHQSLANPI